MPLDREASPAIGDVASASGTLELRAHPSAAT
jgi:hypothetical protein